MKRISEKTADSIALMLVWICAPAAIIALLALLVSMTATPADAGIFRPGQRFIFNWRRPAQDSEPDQDNARPIIDDRLSSPAPTASDKVVAGLIKENKNLKADAAKPKEEPAVVEAAPEPEGSKIPDWSLLALLGAGALTPAARSAIKWLP